ncbi:hypothetical protein AA313_de0208351 [Arthrobotrys entomopaga]|nr:hypothetical protein AA313_de0208351 [Arthrobotrys entomopaga]
MKISLLSPALGWLPILACVSAVSAATPTLSATAVSPFPTKLTLGRDWNLNATDFGHLEMKKSCRMLYTSEDVPLGSKPGDDVPLTWIKANETDYPNLQPINSKYFNKVWCNQQEGWIKMQFNHWDAYNYAWANWHNTTRQKWGDYVIISSDPSCKNYNSTMERHFIRAIDEQRDDKSMVIKCRTKDISFSQAFGEAKPIEMQFANLAASNTRAGGLLAQVNDGGDPDGEFTQIQTQPVDDISGDTAFDKMLDLAIGRIDPQSLNDQVLAAYNFTIEDFYGQSELPDLVRDNLRAQALQSLLRKRKCCSRLRKAASKVKSALQKVGDAIVDAAKDVGKAIIDTAEKVGQAIIDATTVRGSIDRSITFDSTTLGNIVTTPFDNKKGYTLFSGQFDKPADVGNAKTSKGFNETEISGSLDIFCVECGVEGDLKLNGQLVFVILKLDLQTAFISLTGSMGAGLSLGIVANVNLQRTFEKKIGSFTLNPFDIDGILEIGPRLDVSAGVDMELDINGKLLVGANAAWNDINASLDLVNKGNTKASGFKPTVTPIFEIEVDIEASTTFFLQFGVGVGINILKGKFDKSAEIIDKPGFVISAGVGAKFDLQKGVQGVGGSKCAGIDVSLGFTNEVSVNVFDIFEKVLATQEFTAFEKCFDISKRDLLALPAPARTPLIEARADSEPTDDISNATFVNGAVTKLFVRGQDLRLHYAPNGNTYVRPNKALPAGANVSNSTKWDGYFLTDEAGSDGYVIGDSLGRYYNAYNDTLIKYGVSRLRLHYIDEMPRTATLIVMAPVVDSNATQADVPYIMPNDMEGNFYIPVMCLYEIDTILPKIFIANDTTGVATLKSNTADILRDVTGSKVKDCLALPLTNVDCSVAQDKAAQ